jgi:hypothetical protein
LITWRTTLVDGDMAVNRPWLPAGLAPDRYAQTWTSTAAMLLESGPGRLIVSCGPKALND